jgi:Rrf2 family iron-sulfur cluster assembly transcriptional regulator
MIISMNMRDVYRLEALLELSTAYPEARTASAVARRRHIPFPFLARLFSELSREGHVVTIRGPRGGVRLARQPSRIPLAALLPEEPSPEGGGEAVQWLAARLEGSRQEALREVSLARLLEEERRGAAALNYHI